MTPLRLPTGLADRTPAEILGRGAQIVRARLERMGLGDPGRLASVPRLLSDLDGAASRPDDLLNAFRERVAGASFRAFRDPAAAVELLRRRWPEAEEAVLERAGRALRGRFSLLGHQDLEFGEPIDWWLDPTSGIRAPDGHWSEIPYLDRARVGDHKVVWELGRHGHLLDFGRAWSYTGDAAWVEAYRRHLESWMEANPPKRGIHWVSSLEVAFRSIAWLWSLHFVAPSRALDAMFFARLVAWLRVGGHHIERYLSTHFSPNTHLTGEALGLVYIGTLLPELPEAERWRRLGIRTLLAALPEQVRSDGVYFEQSTYYHRYTTDIYLHLHLLSSLNGLGLEGRLRAPLEGLVDHLAYIGRPDGSTPLVGDEDGGRLLHLDERPVDDFRSPLLTAAVLFDRPDWAFVGGPPSQELLWLLGREGVDRLEGLEPRPPERTSRAFEPSGFYVVRSDWTGEADYALVRAGPLGGLSAGHAHADTLAVDLVIRGDRLLVDRGTASYTDERIRRAWRASASHNTVTVDDHSSSEPKGPFRWEHRASGSRERWIDAAGFVFFRGRHDGFQRLDAPATHERSILYLRDACWVVRDRILPENGGTAVRTAVAHFHFAPGCEVLDTAEDGLTVRTGRGRLVRVISARGGVWTVEESAVSTAYGRIIPAVAAACRTFGRGALELVTFLCPARDEEPVEIEALRAEGGRVWRLEGVGDGGDPGTSDLLILRDEAPFVAVADPLPLRTDFQWTWLRLGPEGDVRRVIGLDGRHLELPDADPIDAGEVVEYVSRDSGSPVASGDPRQEGDSGSSASESYPGR